MIRRSNGRPHVVSIVETVAITLASCAIASRAAAEGSAPAPRVRSAHPVIALLIADAIERSATFRREVETIGATDGLVYVHEGHCGYGVFACLAMTVEIAGPYRMLRVKVDLRRSAIETMADIGHELQHAIEVLHDPHVTSNARIVSFYRQLAPTGNDRFETEAAIRAGIDVDIELRARPPRR